MKSIINNVVVKNFKSGNNLKYRRLISGKCEVKNIYNSKNIILNRVYCFESSDRKVLGCIYSSLNKKNYSSFMKNVIEQVKKDMKENKKYQEALKELKDKIEIEDKAIKLKRRIEENTNFFKTVKEKNAEAIKIICNDINNFVSYCFENYYALKYSKYITVKLFLTLKELLINTTNKLIELSEKWNDNNAFVHLDKWRQEMAIKRFKKKNAQINEKKGYKNVSSKNVSGKNMSGKNISGKNVSAKNVSKNFEENEKENSINYNDSDSVNNANEQSVDKNKNCENKEGSELILTYESAWDKFGSKLKDMPFLNNFFENPILGKLFGETELAAALREMKMHDKNFKLSELMYLFEYVISKHIVESYLIGDEETLRLHCGPSAFNSLNASINERKKKKVFLDTNVLIYKNHELKGAQRMEESTPWFIFTFHTQQINCLKNKNDEIIEGKIDDIREVVYTIALSKHPEPEKEGLLYPYIVREFAIIGNTPSW
ncbi:mitochondrial import inner membrane translocase subunit TIM44 [Plasmodium brasilianum]|uniref:Mitochondrial import inner membrane translocase subunit TIM44 n=1 Tax=Plasmodium brasilianum TaxID=5824 RepID=A0ACB9YA36_PLABR|nr:mitochondrial import inner membrane translocase subunit TIM44 [Plasmodium brasilianum]